MKRIGFGARVAFLAGFILVLIDQRSFEMQLDAVPISVALGLLIGGVILFVVPDHKWTIMRWVSDHRSAVLAYFLGDLLGQLVDFVFVCL